MNYQEIKRASFVLGIGFFFVTLYTFISLNEIPGFSAASVVQPAFYVGFTLLTVGSYLTKKEHRYFKASFIAFLCLDVFILALVTILGLRKYQPNLVNVLNTVLKIIFACNNALLALGIGLYTNGLKGAFADRKNKRMYAYAMTMEYGVTGLLLFSTILSLINFEGMSLYVATAVNVGLSVLIYGGYSVFMFVTVHCLKEKKKAKTKSNR